MIPWIHAYLTAEGEMNMRKTDDPCTICKNYSAEDGFVCNFNENCPVADMKRKNERLNNEVSILRRRINRMKSDARWDDEIRRGQVQGMW